MCIQILALSLVLLMPHVGHAQQTTLVESLRLAPQRKQSDIVSKKAWPAFFTALRAAVRKRDQSTLREMMPLEFTYDCCVNQDENGDGETRDEAFRIWDASKTEGWDALNRLLAQGVVTASAQWTRQNGRSRPNFIAPPSANRGRYDGPIADFEYRNGRWWFVSFQFSERDDASGTPPSNEVSASLGTKAANSIRSIDFKNFTYPSPFCNEQFHVGNLVQVREGSFTKGRDLDEAFFVIKNVTYGDLTGDGIEEAVIQARCGLSASSGPGSTEVFVFTVREGRSDLLTEMNDVRVSEDYIRYNPQGIYGGIADDGVTIRKDTLLVKALVDGPHCCPRFAATLSYGWDGKTLIVNGKPLKIALRQ